MIISIEHHIPHLSRPSLDVHAQIGQEEFRKGASHHATDGFACRTSAASAVVAHSIFHLIGEIGMRRTKHIAQIIVVCGMLLLVAHNKSDGTTGCTPFKHARKQLYAVALAARGRDPTLPGSTTIQFALNVVHIHLHSRWHTVDHAAHGCTVALAEGRQSEIMTKRIHKLLFC